MLMGWASQTQSPGSCSHAIMQRMHGSVLVRVAHLHVTLLPPVLRLVALDVLATERHEIIVERDHGVKIPSAWQGAMWLEAGPLIQRYRVSPKVVERCGRREGVVACNKSEIRIRLRTKQPHGSHMVAS